MRWVLLQEKSEPGGLEEKVFFLSWALVTYKNTILNIKLRHSIDGNKWPQGWSDFGDW